ncbi:MBL fold metallo-hydrolase [Putridiphycobacter roseus]|uniref:MBL fold metallo-hydrolase n=1 Tax=Putridiphycobacter roseus TaxID=2219161 RepID=A0A2W1NG25_9FLAO|nr:MBL fold metallo-hydrolase [Putridiphycobacter roseus]PZE16986.1 MBL fold metallo-hydrolase [Putridiphycobacter roseus]
MEDKLQITFLGTGTSQGVPVIACQCAVCLSTNSKDKRLRSSIMIGVGDKNIVVDTGPDFRQQMLRENVQHLEAILFTHGHKDHVAGMDDIRAFNYAAKADMPVYANEETEVALKREFYYVFSGDNYPGIPKVLLNRVDLTPFELFGKTIIPIGVMHYKMPVTAYRIDDFTYITDANFISPAEKEKIKGTEVLVVNALRLTPHISHFTLAEALALIEEINPKKAYLTHVSHLLGKHDEVSKLLPPNVEVAYDGLTFTLS